MCMNRGVVKSVVVSRYGPPEVAVIEDRSLPSMKPNEILVKVEAVAVTAGDARMRGGNFPRGFAVPARLALGLTGPRVRVLGSSFSGIVEQVGSEVTGFAEGDEIAGMNGARMRAHAQFAAIRSTSIVQKPKQVSHIEAAGVLFGGTTAMHFLRDRIAEGSRVLVNGASGAVGSCAVQLSALVGAEVTAVTSQTNVELVTRLGATHAIDYQRKAIGELPEHDFDLVFDAVGNIDRALGLRLTTPEGYLVLAAANLWDDIRAGGRVLANPATESAGDMTHLLGLLEHGRLDSLTKSLGGLDAVVDAYRIVDSGRKVGNIVVQPWA